MGVNPIGVTRAFRPARLTWMTRSFFPSLMVRTLGVLKHSAGQGLPSLFLPRSNRGRFRTLVPSMEGRQVARVPGLAKPRSAQIPVGADLARHGPQVVPEVHDRGSAPEPITVLDAVDDKSRLEHECVRNHRIVLGVGVLRDVEVLLHRSVGVGEEGRLGANRRAELL